MFRLLLLLLLITAVVSVAVVVISLILTAVIMVAMMCAVGIPLYVLGRQWWQRHAVPVVARTPVDRLKDLYIEGKIDLFEFERQVERVLALER